MDHQTVELSNIKYLFLREYIFIRSIYIFFLPQITSSENRDMCGWIFMSLLPSANADNLSTKMLQQSSIGLLNEPNILKWNAGVRSFRCWCHDAPPLVNSPLPNQCSNNAYSTPFSIRMFDVKITYNKIHCLTIRIIWTYKNKISGRSYCVKVT